VAAITLNGIEKRYEGAQTSVVKRVDLDIKDGEFVVLVGPSGCGKSTTLRMIAGLETITSGELLIDGKRSNDVAPGDRDLAMVFQSYALYPHMSVRENIAFGLKVRKLPSTEIETRTKEAAAMLGLEELLDRKPKQLSGGQRQRVAMARAIVRRPKAFLFDEPLSNLDAKLRMEVRAEIASLRRKFGTTTVYVTHDQVEAMTLADRIVVLNEGVVQQVGAPLPASGESVRRHLPRHAHDGPGTGRARRSSEHARGRCDHRRASARRARDRAECRGEDGRCARG
jgi:ABC-type sugar transport system ATPase subunit